MDLDQKINLFNEYLENGGYEKIYDAALLSNSRY